MTEGTHNGKKIDFYGVLKEVIELQYPLNYQVRRTVVLFRCDWYNQVGKTVGLRDDKHFKSINVQSLSFHLGRSSQKDILPTRHNTTMQRLASCAEI